MGLKRTISSCGLGLLAMGFFVAAEAQDLVPAQRLRGEYGRIAPEVLAGEVVVVSDVSQVVVAVDQTDDKGRTDGRVDRLLFFFTPQPIFSPISLRDPAAEIQIRPDSLRVLSHTDQREIEMRLSGVAPTPHVQDSPYALQTLPYGVQLYGYSGAVVREFSLADVQERGLQLLSDLRARSEKLAPSNPTGPGDGDSGSCTRSCSKTCRQGACATACQAPSCAHCQCLGNPEDFPSCYCA